MEVIEVEVNGKIVEFNWEMQILQNRRKRYIRLKISLEKIGKARQYREIKATLRIAKLPFNQVVRGSSPRCLIQTKTELIGFLFFCINKKFLS